MKTILRPILAVVAGYVAWMVAFWIPMVLMTLVWPALQAAAQTYFEQGHYDVFDTPMLISFQLVWPIANATAGFVTRLIARRQREVWWLALLLFAYFAYNHLWALWYELPTWYNVIVIIPVVPMVLVGGRLGGRVTNGQPRKALDLPASS